MHVPSDPRRVAMSTGACSLNYSVNTYVIGNSKFLWKATTHAQRITTIKGHNFVIFVIKRQYSRRHTSRLLVPLNGTSSEMLLARWCLGPVMCVPKKRYRPSCAIRVCRADVILTSFFISDRNRGILVILVYHVTRSRMLCVW